MWQMLLNRYVGMAAAALALILVCWLWLTAHDKAQQAIGRAEVQSAWDIDKARIATLAAAAQADAITNEEAARRRNEAIHADLEAKAADAATRADTFARRLRNAEARLAADSGAVQGNPSGPAPLPPSGTGSRDELRRLLAAYRSECDRNADALDGIYASISPQL